MLYSEQIEKNNKNIRVSKESKALAENFINLDESLMATFNCSIARNGMSVLQDPSVRDFVKQSFIEGAFDPLNFDADEDAINEHIEFLEKKFDNNIKAMFNTILESAGTNQSLGLTNLNAIVGLSLPISKDILMNNMFVNTLPSMVADNKILNKQFEIRRLIDPVSGNSIDLYREQNKIFELLYKSNPTKIYSIQRGETVNLVEKLSLGQNENIDNVKVAKVTVSIDLKEGDIMPDGSKVESDKTEDVTLNLGGLQLNQTYNDPTLYYPIQFNGRNVGAFVLTRRYNELTLFTQDEKVKSVEVICVKDNSVLSTTPPRVEWEIRSEQISIDNQVFVATNYTPQTVYDHKTLHNVDILGTIIETTRTVLEDYKDVYLIESLNADFERMHPTQKVTMEVDFAAKDGYHDSIQAWIDNIFPFRLNDMIDSLFRIINDPNAEVLIYGKPSLIGKVMPKNESGKITNFRSPNRSNQNVEFAKSTYSMQNRKVSFISSQKLQNKQNGSDNNEFMVILNPTNERTMYKLVEYQTYLGGEIKPAASAHLPTITAFDRFELIKFEAVQGRIRVLNQSGLRSDQTDADLNISDTKVATIERNLRTVSPENVE